MIKDNKMYINEEGEPTNSVSAGSMDSHEATDGKCKKKKTKIARRKKMTKYKEYQESLQEDHVNDGWVVYNYDEATAIKNAIVNLNIPPTDYVMYPLENYVEFKKDSDLEAVLKLIDDPHHQKPFHPYHEHEHDDHVSDYVYDDEDNEL